MTERKEVERERRHDQKKCAGNRTDLARPGTDRSKKKRPHYVL